jgi:nitrous oxidase accessory protein NosD
MTMRLVQVVFAGVVVASLLMASFVAMPGHISATPQTHSPILIDGNSEFVNSSGVVWGSGTAEDPYLIEGWSINASWANGIEVRNTDAYFIIRNVRVYNGSYYYSQGYSYCGIVLSSVMNARIESCNLWRDAYGIAAYECRGLIVVNSTLEDCTVGVYATNSQNLAVSNNTMYDLGWGVGISSGRGVRISGNVVKGEAYGSSYYGIDVESYDDTVVLNNSILNMIWYGIYLGTANNTLVSGNVVDNQGLSAASPRGIYATDCQGKVLIENNTITNVSSGVEVYPSVYYHAYQLYVIGNNTISSSGTGIRVEDLMNAIITGNLISNCDLGITASYLLSSAITGNQISNCGRGLSGYQGQTEFVDNEVSGCTYGVYADSSRIVIGSNSFSDNLWGVFLSSPSDSRIAWNNILHSTQYGIYLFRPINTTVHHNDFVGNTVHAYDEGPNPSSWNASYPYGGNYWDNYTGSDLNNGPGQNLAGPDGIGDTPLLIETNNQDNYPLMSPAGANGAPNASFTVSPPGGGTSVSYAFNASLSSDPQDPQSYIEARWDFENDGLWDTPWSTDKTVQHSYRIHGTYTACLEVRDTGGLTDQTTNQITLVDDLGPVTTCTLAGTNTSVAGGWWTSQVSVTLNASDESGVAATNYRVDSGAWEEYRDTFVIAQEGRHVLELYSVDNLENEEAVHSIDINVDLNGPNIFATYDGAQGKNGWYTSDVEVTLSATDPLAGAGACIYSADSANWRDYTVPFMVTGNGYHQVTVQATDLAGHANYVYLTVKIDKIGPSSEGTLTGNIGLGGWYTTWAALSISSSDNMSGVNLTWYRYDDGDWNTSIMSGYVEITEEGAHTIEYRTEDNAGNLGTINSCEFKRDSSSPMLTVIEPLDGAMITTDTMTIRWSGSDSISGIAYYEYGIGGPPFYNCSKNNSVVLSGLTNSQYYIVVRAHDNAGNIKEVQVLVTIRPESGGGGIGTGGLLSNPLFIGSIAASAVAAALACSWILLRKRKRSRGGNSPP